jgi:ATP-dependent 26S proteasome regulatory subunit
VIDDDHLENSPAIIFIDEIDAIATKRFDAQTGGSFVPAHK